MGIFSPKKWQQKVRIRIQPNTANMALLMILSKWGQSDFWHDPGDVVHFDVIFPLIKKLTLIKVKSHAGCFLNEMAVNPEPWTLNPEPIYRIGAFWYI